MAATLMEYDVRQCLSSTTRWAGFFLSTMKFSQNQLARCSRLSPSKVVLFVADLSVCICSCEIKLSVMGTTRPTAHRAVGSSFTWTVWVFLQLKFVWIEYLESFCDHYHHDMYLMIATQVNPNCYVRFWTAEHFDCTMS